MKIKLVNAFFVIIVLFLLICIYNNFKSIRSIQNYTYSEYVEVSGNVYVYNNNSYKKIGEFNKVSLQLETYDKSGYYKIKDTDLYINYKNIKTIDKIKIKQLNYLPFNEVITTNKKFDLYKDNKKIGNFNTKMEFNYYMHDDKFYYINYLNDIYQILKTDIDLTTAVNNNEYTNYIPVLNVQNISTDNCYNLCIRQNRLEEIINYITDNNYKTISLDEYYKWLNNNIVEPKNTIVILSNDEINTNLIINKKDDKFTLNNKASQITDDKTNISSYQINNNTNISNLKDIIDGKEIINKNIDDTAYADDITVLNYHFFYDKTKGEQVACHENICEEITNFRQHLEYLNNNGFKTLTMEEFRAWIYGEIELPKKSVLITVDDGAFGTDTHLPELLNEYQINATLFLITAWWPKEKYISPYLEIESHGYDIHTSGACGKGKIICLSKEDAIKDLNISIEKLSSNLAFCYPFYAHNDLTKEEVKEAGFKLAFIGGFRSASRLNDKFEIPRYPIYDNTTFENFVNMVNS